MSSRDRLPTKINGQNVVVDINGQTVKVVDPHVDFNTNGITQLREALREEIAWREGILNVWPSYHFLGSYWTKRSPYIVKDPHGMCYGKDGETIIVADGSEKRIYEMDRDGVRLWDIDVSGYGTGQPADVDYHPQSGRVIAAVMGNTILEIQNGLIVNTLTATNLGPMHFNEYGGKLQYDAEDPNKFWLADYHNHVVYRSNFNGIVDKQFGTYGISGYSDTLLTNPTSVAVWNTFGVISDPYNYRQLTFDVATMSIQQRFPACGRVCVELSPFWAGIHIHGAFSVDAPPVSYVTTAPMEWLPKYVLPFYTNKMVFHPKEPFTVLISRDWTLYELDLRAFRGSPLPPAKWRLMNGWIVLAGVTYNMFPFADWFFKMKTIHILSTQAATLYIDVARLCGEYGRWRSTEDWDVYDSVTLAANTLHSYSTENAIGIIRPRLVMGGVDGTVYCWAEMTSQ